MKLLHAEALVEPTLTELFVRRYDVPGAQDTPCYVIIDANGEPTSPEIPESLLGAGFSIREINSAIESNRAAMLSDHAELVKLGQSTTDGGNAPELKYRPGSGLAARVASASGAVSFMQEGDAEEHAKEQQRLVMLGMDATRRLEAKAEADAAKRKSHAEMLVPANTLALKGAQKSAARIPESQEPQA